MTKVDPVDGFEPTTAAPSIVVSKVVIERLFKSPSHFPNQIFPVGCLHSITLLDWSGSIPLILLLPTFVATIFTSK